MRTLIGVNNLQAVDSLVYANHMQFFHNLAKQFPKDEFILFTPRRMSIDMMRNTAARAAIDHDCTYLMFIDDDVLIPVNAYRELRSDIENGGADVAGSLTIIRGYPYPVMAFREPREGEDPNSLPYFNDYANHIDDKTGLVNCTAIGFSCVVLAVAALNRLTTPFFITGPNHTEDVYYCLKAIRELGKENFKVTLNPDVKTGHLGMPAIITDDNKRELARLDEFEMKLTDTLMNKKKEPSPIDEKTGDRTLAYLEMCK